MQCDHMLAYNRYPYVMHQQHVCINSVSLCARILKKSKSKIVGRFSADWPAVATFRRPHNHSTTSDVVLKHRPLGSVSRQRLRCLFQKGHKPSSALRCLKTELKIKHGDDYDRIAGDTYNVPTLSIAHKLYRSEYQKETGSLVGEHTTSDLQSIVSQYCEESGGTAKCGSIGDNLFVALCSPLMSRVHELMAGSCELMMVDVVAGRRRKCHHWIYSLLTPSSAGMLPLGIIITDNRSDEVLEAAVCCLKSCFPAKSFFGRGYPRTILIDCDMPERPALERVFDNTRILFGHLGTLKAVWSWLCDTKNGIHENYRQDLYSSFRSVLYAEMEGDMINRHLFLVSSCAYSFYKSFAGYYDTLWNLRSYWALALRGGVHTTGCIEATFWIWKDCILDRMKSLGLPQLFGFVSSCYESYVEKRLLDFCNGTYRKSQLESLVFDGTEIPDCTVTVLDEQSLTYSVNTPHLSEVHSVDLEKAACSCYAGGANRICGHFQAVLLMLDESLYAEFCSVFAETKQVLFGIATGTKPPPESMVARSCSDIAGTGDSCSSQVSDEDNEQFNTQVSDEDIDQFCSMLCARMKDRLHKAPHVFGPAFQRMRSCMAASATDADFFSAFQEHIGMHSMTHVGQCEQRQIYRPLSNLSCPTGERNILT